MANGIRTGNPRGFNKGHSSKFPVSSQVRQTPEEGRRTYRPKHCGNNNKGEDNSPKNLNDKNHQKYVDKKMSIMFYQIYIQIYIYIYSLSLVYYPLLHYFVARNRIGNPSSNPF